MPRKFKIRRRYDAPRLEVGKEYEGPARWFEPDSRNPQIKHPVIPISPYLKVVVTRHTRKVGKNETIKYRVNRIVRGVALATLVEEKPKPVIATDLIRGTPVAVTPKIRSDRAYARLVEGPAKDLAAIIERDYREALRPYGVGDDVPITDIDKMISLMLETYGKERKVLEAIEKIRTGNKTSGYLRLSTFLSPFDRKDVSNLDRLCYKTFGFIWRAKDKEYDSRNYDISNSLFEIMILRDWLDLEWQVEETALRNFSMDMKIGRFDGIPDGDRVLGYLVDDSGILDEKLYNSFIIELFDLERKWDEKEVQRMVDEFASELGINISNVIRKRAYISTSSEESARKMFDMLKGEKD